MALPYGKWFFGSVSGGDTEVRPIKRWSPTLRRLVAFSSSLIVGGGAVDSGGLRVVLGPHMEVVHHLVQRCAEVGSSYVTVIVKAALRPLHRWPTPSEAGSALLEGPNQDGTMIAAAKKKFTPLAQTGDADPLRKYRFPASHC